MELVEVDHVDPEPAEGGIASRPDLLGPEPRPLGSRGYLRRHEDAVASPGESLTDQHLGHAIAVDLSGVDPVHPGVDPRTDRIHHLGLRPVGTPGVTAGLPRPESDHRKLGTLGPQSLRAHATYKHNAPFPVAVDLARYAR